MAQISFNIATADIARIAAAMEHRFGLKGEGETNAAFVKRHMIALMDNWTQSAEGEVYQQAFEYADLDIT